MNSSLIRKQQRDLVPGSGKRLSLAGRGLAALQSGARGQLLYLGGLDALYGSVRSPQNLHDAFFKFHQAAGLGSRLGAFAAAYMMFEACDDDASGIPDALGFLNGPHGDLKDAYGQYIDDDTREEAMADQWRFCRQQAQAGEPFCQTVFGRLYAYVNDSSVGDPMREAWGWVRRGADAGFANAQWLLSAKHLRSGKRAAGRALLVSAAEQWHAEACYDLGDAYKRGLWGVPVDPVQAAAWFERALKQGSIRARLVAGYPSQRTPETSEPRRR